MEPKPESPSTSREALDDDRERPVDARHVTVERIVGWIAAAGLSAASFLAAAIALATARPAAAGVFEVVGVWVLFVAALGSLAHGWPPLAYRRLAWRLDARRLEIRRGVVWREVVTVPRSRVQHTDVSQGPIERRFGIATLVVHTAGTLHASVHLPGLEHAVAMRLRDHLLEAGRGDAV